MNRGLQSGTGVDVLFLTLNIRYDIGLNDVSKPGFSLFDVPEGIQNLKYPANHNISTHKA
jgi:hypothetical protein